MPGATQVVKYSLREVKLPRAAWVSLGPNPFFLMNDVQIPYDCLLDDGAHLVLIRPETVTDLGLPIRRLHKPVTVTVALNHDPDALTELWDYVSLSLSSLNNAWSSKPVRALIAPGLCSNVLLGLPFLVHNKIVIDHASRTAVDKTYGFDLMNENSCRVAPPSL
jgi:hypothetical protein